MIARLLRGSPHDVMARLSGLLLAVILFVSVGAYAVIHYGWLDQGPQYQAEFADAWPLVAGMDVRVDGAVVGSVRQVVLTDRGTALVTFQLRPGVPVPRANASVAIRQDDLLGDSDLSLELGTSSAALHGPIPASRAIQEPRLDDFLDIFHAPVRTALQAFIVEVGNAMENRGIDVNDAILDLRPGFEALGNVFDEVSGQVTALRQVLDNAHQVTSQLAGRSQDLDRLIVGLQRTISDVTAQDGPLDAGLAALPGTLSATESTLQRVSTLTGRLAPLAATVSAAAPGFDRAATLVGPYARSLTQAARYATPTIRLAGNALRAGGPALKALSKTQVSSLLNPTSGLFGALAPILSELSDGLFGTVNGKAGLGSVVLPGNDLTAPNIDPARDFLSAYLVVDCALFGVPDSPGCLAKILTTYGAGAQTAARPRTAPATSTPGPAASSPSSANGGATPTTPAQTPTTPAQTPTTSAGPTTAFPSGSPTSGLGSLIHYLLGR